MWHNFKLCLMLKSGYAAGRHNAHTGGGSNQLCLPEEPQWKSHVNTSVAVGWLFGIEYRTHNVHEVLFSGVNNQGSNAFHGKPTPCAICYVPGRSASLMIPARTSCPDGWTQEYTGYLMSEHSFNVNIGSRYSTTYICVDGAPEVATGPVLQAQAVLLVVKVGCGTLPCSKYNNKWEVACVVCSK